MIKSIAELARALKRSPQELLKTIRDAGIDKSSTEDSLSASERSRLNRVLAPGRNEKPANWGSISSSTPSAGAGSAAGSRRAPRKVEVKVRKKSIHLSDKNPLAASDSTTGIKAQATQAPGAEASVLNGAGDNSALAAKPIALKRKRVFSSETKQVIQDSSAASAENESARGEDDIATPSSSGVGADNLPATEFTEGSADGAQSATSSSAASTKSDRGAGKADVADSPSSLSDAVSAQGKGDKPESSSRKRSAPRRERVDLTEADEDLSFPDPVAPGQPVDASPVVAGAYDPASYLHIKKSFRKRRRVKTQTSQKKENLHAFRTPANRVKLKIDLPESISVQELASRLHIKNAELAAHLRAQKLDVIDGMIDQDSAALVVEHLGHTFNQLESDSPIVRAKSRLQYSGEAVLAPPVVTIMGHVDHGKTTLIDRLRQSQLVGGEYGAITQHIGAYRVPVRDGGFVTFLDTPGHAAFANMRERGARITDIVVVVVAADDGVKPQTAESVEYARRYQIPIVVAVNKVDKENANPELVRKAMVELEVVPEDWGGENQFVEISALKNQGMNQLLEAIYLQAEMIDKKVQCAGDAFGYVIESGQRKGIGITASILLKKGSLKSGQTVSAGQSWGRVRYLLDEDNKKITLLTPGVPATLVGLNKVVEAGSEIFAVGESVAREIETYSRLQTFPAATPATEEIDADALFADLEKKSRTKSVNLYIKTDVQGSTEAVKKVLEEVDYPDFDINIVSCRQGGVYESDVQTAASTRSTIIGFNVSADGAARKLAENSGVELHLHRSVYEIFDYVDGLVRAQVEPTLEYIKVGEARVREIFRSSAFGSVAGCMIVDGVVHKNDVIRVIRDSIQIFEGRLDSLRRFKDDVQAVNMGSECGIAVKKFGDLHANDVIESFTTKETMPTRRSSRDTAEKS
ncbi:MAG: translation initiation factor IF-2 [Gammaproteobacteria bacterium]|nr:translation initiation factor IF-2 [Gammaproteobacteria bacterium]